ncbi:MAG: HPF/RaiA family ribosome-associated protein [Candidatus Woesearchaeota archaeon]
MEELKLGAKISLVGFKEIPRAEMQIVKKILGNYLNALERYSEVTGLSITLRILHNSEKQGEVKRYELKAQLNSKLGTFHSDAMDVNLFSALDELLKKIEKQMSKEKEKRD